MTGDGLGQAHRLTGGLADVGVVQEPVDGRGGQRFGHQLVKPNWDWHTFVEGQTPRDLGLLPFGVSAGLRGVMGVC